MCMLLHLINRRMSFFYTKGKITERNAKMIREVSLLNIPGNMLYNLFQRAEEVTATFGKYSLVFS